MWRVMVSNLRYPVDLHQHLVELKILPFLDCRRCMPEKTRKTIKLWTLWTSDVNIKFHAVNIEIFEHTIQIYHSGSSFRICLHNNRRWNIFRGSFGNSRR